MYADEDSLPSEKEEEKQVSIMNNKNVLRQSENKTVIYVRQEGATEKSELQNHDNIDDGGLVVIKITPDENGRFGFNVKGGADLDLPVRISLLSQSGTNFFSSHYSRLIRCRYLYRGLLQTRLPIVAIRN